eukprot:TRINITY_DN52710_c0_g1_i13.p1 TRINITY_DN52710_c0_g1~~TRINITY_DN52710_c0_g1_i13.p1  ORF type:complete len:277 (-),score=26.76 TRINITY_DN52710_c0_g1_i13:565-1296(-)
MDNSLVHLQVSGSYIFQLQEVLQIFRNIKHLDLREFGVFGTSMAVQRMVMQLVTGLSQLNNITFANDTQVEQLMNFNNLHNLRNSISIILQTCSSDGLLRLAQLIPNPLSQEVTIRELHLSFEAPQISKLSGTLTEDLVVRNLLVVHQLVLHVFVVDQVVLEGLAQLRNWLKGLRKITFQMYDEISADFSSAVEKLNIGNVEICKLLDIVQGKVGNETQKSLKKVVDSSDAGKDVSNFQHIIH